MNTPAPATPIPVQPFTLESLKAAWQEFAEQRKLYKAEFQLLNQEIELNDSTVVLHLMNPVQETLLNSLKAELMQFIREKLNNFTIQIQGELVVSDHKQVIYTNREKFEHLATKNPNLRILKDRLGLDPDY
jgi:DNA polymerase-3 subunit gamma/tau